MKLIVTLAALAALPVCAVQAAPQIQTIIYNVDAADLCSRAANNQAELKAGLAACDTALKDPAMIHRAALLLDRGVIQVRMGNNEAALTDYSGAIALDPKLGDAYISRAGVLLDLKRYEEARTDISQGLALGAANLHVAYYTSGLIAEENGDPQSAYRNYRQALALKPGFAPASRELARFKLVPRRRS